MRAEGIGINARTALIRYNKAIDYVPIQDESDIPPTEPEQNCDAVLRAAGELMSEIRSNPTMYKEHRQLLIEARLMLGKALFAIDEIQPEYQLRLDENGVPYDNVWRD